MRISYAIVDSPLGRMLVAATESGICHLSLGEDDRRLEAELRGDYPSDEIHRATTVPRAWIDRLLDYLAGKATDLNLPTDVRATEFQRRVWDALRAIPYGSTRTYGEIARSLGYTKAAARAVGHACATNPVSLVIPCHRAVREGGSLGGYRWGLARKRALIDRECGTAKLF
jgi:AraC family transcriptional regulator, regulatory protein of adaptative response / methylated-DNA-[protein]-cysteine methyltransferase